MKRVARYIVERFNAPLVKDIPDSGLVWTEDWVVDLVVWLTKINTHFEEIDIMHLISKGSDAWQAEATAWMLGASPPSKILKKTVCCPHCKNSDATFVVEAIEVYYPIEIQNGRLFVWEDERQEPEPSDQGSPTIFLCEKCGTRWDIPNSVEMYFPCADE